MIIPKGLTEGYDTRGLPFEYDPHKFYEYQFEKIQKTSTGVEWMLYQYIPVSVIKSVALAIDPLAPFKVAPGVITPANRRKYRATASVLQVRKVRNTVHNTSNQQLVNYQGVGGCRSCFTVAVTPNFTTSLSGLPNQDPLPDTLNDTTSRTRLMGSQQGTLDLFKGHINSPPRSVMTIATFRQVLGTSTTPSSDECIKRGGTYQVQSDGANRTYRTTEGAGSRLPILTHTQLRLSEIAYNEQLISANVLGMLKGWSPERRAHTLFRNVAELRDIPRSVSSLRTTLGDLRNLYTSLSSSPSLRKIIFDLRATSKDIPNEYLSFHFGWKQLYKDIMDLVVLPGKISKKVNFLIERNGKPTTYRSKRSFISGETGVSGFEYENLSFENDVVLNSRIERSTELRLVINATFDFPNVDSPSFRLKEFGRQIGAVPRPTDLYNLVPWTWLLDWFTGLGNYVEIIDNMNSDRSLINWGMITAVSNGSLISERNSSTNCSDSITFGGTTTTTNYKRRFSHTSRFDYVCEIRKDISTSLGVNKTSVIDSLSSYQKSILGALLLQRVNFSGAGAFRPRS
jgi:hypothetical protein